MPCQINDQLLQLEEGGDEGRANSKPTGATGICYNWEGAKGPLQDDSNCEIAVGLGLDTPQSRDRVSIRPKVHTRSLSIRRKNSYF